MRPHSAWYPWVQTSRRARVLSLCKGLSSGGLLSTRCSHLLSEKSDLESSPCHRPPGKEELRHQRGAWRAPPKPGSVSCELLRACRWPSARTGGGTAGVEGAGFLYFSSNSPAYWIAQNISREEKHPALEGGRHVEKSRLVQVQVICT